MGSKWTETGILRKKQTKENFDDLLVFGYACKLFRDDERALYIDQGKHLIPWMGDERLKIDRYDGRGALSDLSSCEASREGYDTTRWLGLSETERKLEQLCDEERYYSLHNNEEEENTYKEEQLKREVAKEFHYNYNVPAPEEPPMVATCEEEDKVFIPPKELDVPNDIDIPKTVKENARIEKTALFVSQQGPQMEILIKAKQSDNPQFSFMNRNDPLQKYYKHLLNAIKSGQYTPERECDETKKCEDIVANQNAPVEPDQEEHYLHPTLTVNQPTNQTVLPAVPPTPVFQYKASADCAYTKLVSRIKGVTHEALNPPNNDRYQSAVAQQEASDQYYQYYQAQYYQYYRQIAQQYATQGNYDMNTIMQNQHLQEQIQQQAVRYAQAACAHYVPNQMPAAVQQPPIPSMAETETNSMPEKPVAKLSLVHYSSDSEEGEENEEIQENSEDKFTYNIPPDDIAVIIEKMATYVSKNGVDFENTVRNKGDPRFDFLNESHKFHTYYKIKVAEFTNNAKCNQPPSSPGKANTKAATKNKSPREADNLKEKKAKTPVSFSIKKTKDDAPKDIKSALPLDEESDEEIPLESLDCDNEDQRTGTTTPPSPEGSFTPPLNSEHTAIDALASHASGSEINNQESKIYTVKDYIFEMIDLTSNDACPSAKGTKKEDDRDKDWLQSEVHERTLQLARKKRAALFLKMKNAGKSDRSQKQNDVKDSDISRIPKTDELVSTQSDSELEDGEIKQNRGHHKKSSYKRTSKNRDSYSKKSRQRKHKKRKSSTYSPSSTSSTSDTE